ncbi:MAG: hypothetical protein LBU23_03325 [Planctomycetota bacterium]|nr:hypothetical protein [Planctomycetota bacterium]
MAETGAASKSERLGFNPERGGVHNARTIMLAELDALLAQFAADDAKWPAYRRAIIEENRLGKPSGVSRRLTARHLRALYGLDPAIPIFRGLLFFWRREPEDRPLLAMLAAVARDPLLRLSAEFVLGKAAGEEVSAADLGELMGRISVLLRFSVVIAGLFPDKVV